MTGADRAAFDHALTALEQLFAWRVPGAARIWYWRALEDLPLEAVQAGFDLVVRHYRSEHGRFPRPADLRGYATAYVAERHRGGASEDPPELTEEERAEVLVSIRHLLASLTETRP